MADQHAILALGVVRRIGLWGSLPPEELCAASTFGEMAYDSLDHLELAMALEDALNITVPDAVIGTWSATTTIADIGADVQRIIEGAQ